MKKPYHFIIKPNGDWAYFVKGKPVDVYDYRQAVAAVEHKRKQRPREVVKQGGAYIAQRFTEVRSKQLARNIHQYHAGHPDCTYSSWGEMERKARSRGFAIDSDTSQDL